MEGQHSIEQTLHRSSLNSLTSKKARKCHWDFQTTTTTTDIQRQQLRLVSILSLLLLFSSSCASMRIVVQRVVHENDTEDDLHYCCKRLLGCKLWPNPDSGGQWRHGVKQRGYSVLCVSQFTLYGTLTKKNQPDYKRSMKAVPAQELYQKFLDMLKENYEADKIHDGEFGAMMDVSLINDGPVTIIIESEPKAPPESSENGNGGE